MGEAATVGFEWRRGLTRHGTDFELEVPMQELAHLVEKRRILLVEDDTDLREALGDALA